MVSLSKSILLVDDDPDVLELMKDILECEGHRVVMATDGLMGTLKVKNQEFDLIISDLNMPKQNGMRFLTNIIKERKTYGKKTPPVIIISGEITPAAKEICYKGKIPILEKPFTSDQILEEIDKAFQDKTKKPAPPKNSTNKTSQVKELAKDEILFEIGDTLKELFLIKSGSFGLYNSKNELIEKLDTGNVLGTAAVIASKKIKLKAVALEESTVSAIPIARITKIIKEQPKWFQSILIKMAKENLQLQEK